MATVFDNGMVAHVWAQGRQNEGRSHNRNFYFEGRKLFSYGSHYVAGYLLPSGSAFINADSYSVSTSRHVSEARRAVRGVSYYLPNLTKLAAFFDSEVFGKREWRDEDGKAYSAPWNDAGRYLGNGEERPATSAELKAARKKLFDLLTGGADIAERRALCAAFELCGAKPAEAAKLAEKAEEAHRARLEAEAEEKAKRKRDEAAEDARRASARPLSDFEAILSEAREEIRASHWAGQAERKKEEAERLALRLFRAAKEAKRRGWKQIAAACMARRAILREGAAALVSFGWKVEALCRFKEKKGELRAALAAFHGAPLPASASRDMAYYWQRSAGRAAALCALFGGKEEAPGLGRLARHARLMGQEPGALAAKLQAIESAFLKRKAREDQKTRRATIQTRVKLLRLWKEAGGNVSREDAERIASAALGLSSSLPPAFACAGFTWQHFRAIASAAQARVESAKREEQAAKLQAWREDLPGARLPSYPRLSDDEGGALLRAHGVKRDEAGNIIGGELQTSWGASVPLCHAIRAFRFLKLCRDKGQGWKANGKTLPVGHFRIESVSPEGSFVAGCHKINWGEVSALAERLGLAGMAPEDTREGA